MKKLIIIWVVIFTCSLCVYAHPGSIDENGGHYNRSTGEYHYHEGTNQENNPTGNSVVSHKQPIRKLFITDNCYVVFWLLLSFFCVSHYFQLNVDSYSQNKGCLLSLLLIPYFGVFVCFSFILSNIILGGFNDFLTPIIAIALFAGLCKLNHKPLYIIVSGILTIFSALLPGIVFGTNDSSTRVIICLFIIYIGNIIFSTHLKTKKEVKCPEPPQSKTCLHITNSQTPFVDEDEQQRIESLLLYVDQLEAARQEYKNKQK